MFADFLHLISDFLYTILRCALGFCGAGGWAGGAGERFLTVRRQKKSGLRFSARAGGDLAMHVQLLCVCRRFIQILISFS